MNSPTEVILAQSEQCEPESLMSNENAQEQWSGLGINLQGQRFVVPMNQVSEMMMVPSATRVPGVKAFVQGIANIRGRMMAVIDLAIFFRAENTDGLVQRHVLAVESVDQYFGFIIDESLGMQHFVREDYTSSVLVDEMFVPFVEGGYQVEGTTWPVISLTRLAADSKLERLAL